MTRRTVSSLLVAILAAFVLLSVTYTLVVPPFEASDELWHYPMVRHIADNWSLPVQDPANVGPWRQEASQPPLYYIIGAISTFWIDTSDMDQVRHLNPHADTGIATPDGNVNLVVREPGQLAFPWTGTILAVYVIRFLSIVMATAGVYMTYLIVREVLPRRPSLALGATALHAFTPMVAFIAGSVNNDNLVVPLSSLALLLLLRLLRTPEQSLRHAVPRYLLLGGILGLAALTKASSLGLTLLTAVVVAIRSVRRWQQPGGRRAGALREFVIGGLSTLLPLLAIAGWWYARNLRLYGDVTGLNAFIAVLGERDVPADLVQLWRERHSFLAGYWGNFGGLNVPMAPWTYQVLNLTALVAGLGLIFTFIKSSVASALLPVAQDKGPRIPTRDTYSMWIPGFVLCILWALGVFIPWIRWARVTWSSQGRLVFPALPVWSMLIALGLGAWLPRGWDRFPIGALALFLLALSAAAPFVWIRPAYQRPESLADGELGALPARLDADFGSTMRLLGYDLETTTTEPGDEVAVTLYWEALGPTQEDHTVFVHLLGAHELVVAQRDTFPGLGLLSTTWLEPGFRWADRYVIRLPNTAYARNEAQLQVGLYQPRTGQRLPAVSKDGTTTGDNVRFGHVDIDRPADWPSNAFSINFGDRMLLTGYELSARAVRPGDAIVVTLHWQASRRMREDYTVSVQFIDERHHKAAQHDSHPQGGDAPTSTWRPDETVADAVPLPVFADAGAGAYAVHVTVYRQDEGELVHLPVTHRRGQMQTKGIALTQIRVEP